MTCAYGKVPLDSCFSGNVLIPSKMPLAVCRSCPHYKECYPDKQREKFDTRATKAEEKGKDSDHLPIWFKTSRKMHLRAVQNRAGVPGVLAGATQLPKLSRGGCLPTSAIPAGWTVCHEAVRRSGETYFGIKTASQRQAIPPVPRQEGAGGSGANALKGENYNLETV